MSKVLVVDDNDFVRKLARQILESHGYDVVLAENGQEALDRVANMHPEVMLLDLSMPVMDGRACAEELRRRQAGVAVVLMSAQDGLEEAAARLGAAGRLEKPFLADDLLAAVVAAAPTTAATVELPAASAPGLANGVATPGVVAFESGPAPA